ncbi:MAG: hypothetical protein A2X49_09670 [Lentisphaerae bacterium GWF2_52_8]|nr:MAG: hypothetical protein A2X49_09670 [Lentisphaerae bacterium GWF2_52_8]
MLAGKKASLWQNNSEIFAAHAAPASCVDILLSAAKPNDFEVGEPDPSGFQPCHGGSGLILLHSRRDPLGEARRQVRAWADTAKPVMNGVVLALGFGGLYHLQALAELMEPGGLLFVADSIPGAAREALGHFDLSPVASKEGVSVLFSVSKDASAIADEFRYHLRQRLDFAVSIFIQPALQRAWPEQYRYLEERLKREFKLEAMNRATTARYMELWQRNALVNLPLSLRCPMMDALAGAFEGKVALILGAGPSLDEAMPLLRRIREKALFIAVGTALKSLLEEGIKPDFVVSVDSVPAVMKQFEGVSADSAWLLTHHQAPPELFNLFENRAFIFAANLLGGFNTWLEGTAALPMRLSVGGTVALTAMDAAISMGCRHIVIAGLDLSFRQDGPTHARHSVYDGCKGEEKLIPVPGNSGQTVMTTPQFAMYIEMLHSYFYCESKEHGMKFYNLALNGAAFHNTELVAPEALEKLPLPFSLTHAEALLQGLHEKAPRPDRNSVLPAFACAIAELEDIERNAAAAKQACEILRDSPASSNARLSAELNRLDASIKGKRTALFLLSGSLRLLAEKCCATGISEKDGFASSLEFYEKCAGSAADARKLIGSALREYAGSGEEKSQ